MNLRPLGYFLSQNRHTRALQHAKKAVAPKLGSADEWIPNDKYRQLIQFADSALTARHILLLPITA
jgi:hypothetical protein